MEFELSLSQNPFAIDEGEFQVTMHVGGPLGMMFDFSEGGCMRISKIEEESSVEMHNKRVMPDEQIHAGDFVMGVNGVRKSTKAMMTAMQCQSKIVVLTLRRAYEFVVDMAKPRAGLGLGVSCHPHSSALVVNEVREDGAVAKWNAGASKDYQIRIDDHILSINHRSGGSKTLLDEMSKSERVEMVISRPAESLYMVNTRV